MQMQASHWSSLPSQPSLDMENERPSLKNKIQDGPLTYPSMDTHKASFRTAT